MQKNQYFILSKDEITKIVEYDGEIFGEYDTKEMPIEKIIKDEKQIPSFMIDSVSIFMTRKRIIYDNANFSLNYIGEFDSVFKMKEYYM